MLPSEPTASLHLGELAVQTIFDQSDQAEELDTTPAHPDEPLVGQEYFREGVQNSYLTTVNLALINSPSPQWSDFCFGVSRDWAIMFGSDGRPFHHHQRREPTGAKFFDQLVQPCVRINSVPQFTGIFDTVTDGILNGLDYDNLLVAGGIVLACLTYAQFEGHISPDSDIDIFVHGVTPFEALAKLLDIEATLRANVPRSYEQYSVERTATTISFVPNDASSGLRKLQIVLRLHQNPGEIIASFDRDEAAVGYDGSEVWLEPRALRAILTGYSVITAKLLHATSEARTIK
ncbi:unnamed protein product [Tilletia controversa]|nr:unnamed protein product [Tilletia controversa]